MARLLIVALLMISTHASAISIEWIPLNEKTADGEPATIKGSPVIEYKNAGEGGIDWVTTGDGPRGGWKETKELWLFDNSSSGNLGTSEASTTFSVLSNAVSFMMAGDHNDGFAQFFVDDIDVGTYDLYQTGHRSLIVTGLDALMHSLRIVQLGTHNESATKGDIAIFGGAAFNTALNPESVIPEPNTLSLILLFIMTFFISRLNNKVGLKTISTPKTAQRKF